MYSRSAKGGKKGDPNRNPWLAKMDIQSTCDCDLFFFDLSIIRRSQLFHSMGTCAAQLTCLCKACGHVTVSDHRLKTGRVQCKFLCLYVVVNIANEDKNYRHPLI